MNSKKKTFIVFILVQHENLYFCFVNIVCTNVFKPFVQDTRALVVQEVFQVEKSYVESLQFLVVVSSHNINMDKTGHLKVLLFSKAFIVVSGQCLYAVYQFMNVQLNQSL